jgi:hypothetical protein
MLKIASMVSTLNTVESADELLIFPRWRPFGGFQGIQSPMFLKPNKTLFAKHLIMAKCNNQQMT